MVYHLANDSAYLSYSNYDDMAVDADNADMNVDVNVDEDGDEGVNWIVNADVDVDNNAVD